MPKSHTMASFERASTLLWLLLRDGGRFDARKFSDELAIPKSTLFRHLNTLLSARLLVRLKRGHYCPNPSIITAMSRYSANDVLAEIARPILLNLAKTLKATAHFGVLEADMVTYIVKSAAPGVELFTRENEQLEAYCSAIGKVALANLSSTEQAAYLASGPFPKLTEQTRTRPIDIKAELAQTARRGFGIDDGEIHENLYCLAVPVLGANAEVVGAISTSSPQRNTILEYREDRLTCLRTASEKITGVLMGRRR